MESRSSNESNHTPSAIVADIDKALLEEEKLLEALKMAVEQNYLEAPEAERILWEHKNIVDTE